MKINAIAIDGPAGAGKSTVAKLVAKKLGYLYIDSGAMYRAIAFKAIEEGIAFDDAPNLTRLADECILNLADGPEGYLVYLDGRDISKEIRLPEVGAAASPVSAIDGVRKSLVAQQQKMSESKAVVMDGRDIGTVVLPNAKWKIFLTASLEERAKRRTDELKAKGQKPDYNHIMADIAQRDKRDSTRANSPLKQAEDGILLDTTGLSIEEVVNKILAFAREE